MPDLLSLLVKRVGSRESSSELLSRTRDSLGVDCELTNPSLLALSLCSLGVPAEAVSSALSWKEFESFCANLLRACGYDVRENVQLRRPGAQIDVVAFGASRTLSLDCKHWKRDTSLSTLAKFARAQLKRSALLRRTLSDARPIVSAILTLTEQRERFVEGVAVVPLHTIRSFVGSVEEYAELLVSS